MKTQLRIKELKEKPIFILSDMYRKEKNYDYKCRIGKTIKILQNEDSY